MASRERLARSPSRATVRSGSMTRPPARSEYVVGVILLLVVVFIWTSSNFVTQGTFDGGYEKPFFITYINVSSFTVYLIPHALRRVRRKWNGHAADASGGQREHYEPLATDEHRQTLHPSDIPPVLGDVAELSPLTEVETARLASVFCFFWFIANWTINAALAYTTIASATILSSMSGFFTLLIGRMFGVESFTVPKISAVLTSFTGVLLVSLSDSSTPALPTPPTGSDQVSSLAVEDHRNQPALGDVLALVSALFYAFYVTLLKVRVGDESRLDARLFFGLVGLFNILTLWPIGIICHFTGIERFELPHGRRVILPILLNMFLTLSSDYLYVLAMLKTTPLLVTVGLSLTIPLAVLADWLFLGRPAAVQVVLGGFLVLLSFVVLGVADAKADSQERERREASDVSVYD